MSRIFIFDKDHSTITALCQALEGNGHEVLTNIVLPKGSTSPKMVLHPVDVIGLLASTRPFPDVIIAETSEVDGGWLCGLVYDMEMSQKCSVILTGHHHTDQVRHLQELYRVPFWSKPFNVMRFVEYIETFFAVSC
ncbi:MAG: hypothetical protein WC465_00390 [Patescibacteria group bacterium]